MIIRKLEIVGGYKVRGARSKESLDELELKDSIQNSSAAGDRIHGKDFFTALMFSFTSYRSLLTAPAR